MLKCLFFCFFLFSLLFGGRFYQKAEKAFQDGVYPFAILSYQKEIDIDGVNKEESYYKIALSYFYLKNYTKSLSFFRQYNQNYPNGKEKVNSYFYQANILYLQKKYEGALNFIFAFLEKNQLSSKEKEAFYFLVADIYFIQQEIELAIEELEKVKFYQNDLNARKASLLYFQKKYKQAEILFQKVNLDSLSFNDNKIISYQKIKTLIEVKQYSQAIKEIDFYLQKNKQENKVYWEIILLKNSIYHYQKKYLLSARQMKSLIQKYQSKIKENNFYKNVVLRANLMLIEDYLALNQKILAFGTVQKLLKTKEFAIYADQLLWKKYKIYKKEKKKYQILKQIYGIYVKEKKYNKNYQIVIEKILLSSFHSQKNLNVWLKAYEKSQPSKNDWIAFLKRIAIYFFEKNNFKESLNLFQKIYNLDSSLSSLIAIGEIYLENNQSKRAIDFFKKINFKEKERKQKEHYRNDVLGYSYLLNNEPLLSISYYQKNTEIEEYKKKSIFYLGENYFLLSQYKKSLTYFQKFISFFKNKNDNNKENKKYLNALYRIGFIYNHQKKYQQSIDFLKQTFKEKNFSNFQEKDSIYYFLAKNYFEFKKYSLVIKQAQQVKKESFYYYDSIFLTANSFSLLKKEDQAKNNYYIILNRDNAPQSIKNKSYYKLINLYLKKKNFLQAEFYLEKMIFFEQNETEYFDASIYKIIDFYYSNQQYDRIENLTKRLEKIKITSEVAIYFFYIYGMSLIEKAENEKSEDENKKLSQKAKAIIPFEKSLNIKGVKESKYYFEIIYQLAFLFYEKKEWQKALENFEIIENSQVKELKKETQTFYKNLKNKIFLQEIEKKNIEEISNLPPQEIPQHLKNDVQFILGKKYFAQKKYDKSYQIVQKLSTNFGIETNLINSFLLKLKLIYIKKEYKNLYKESLSFYYQYEVENEQKILVLFYISYAAYKNNLKKDGDFFYKEMIKIDRESDLISILDKLKKSKK